MGCPQKNTWPALQNRTCPDRPEHIGVLRSVLILQACLYYEKSNCTNTRVIKITVLRIPELSLWEENMGFFRRRRKIMKPA